MERSAIRGADAITVATSVPGLIFQQAMYRANYPRDETTARTVSRAAQKYEQHKMLECET
jgi:hypothetical protein